METLKPGNRRCECEHIAHASSEYPLEIKALTPNGNPGHEFYTQFNERAIVHVRSPYGIYRVCKDCAADCMHDYPVIQYG